MKKLSWSLLAKTGYITVYNPANSTVSEILVNLCRKINKKKSFLLFSNFCSSTFASYNGIVYGFAQVSSNTTIWLVASSNLEWEKMIENVSILLL